MSWEITRAIWDITKTFSGTLFDIFLPILLQSEVGHPLWDQLHQNASTGSWVMQLTIYTLTWTMSSKFEASSP